MTLATVRKHVVSADEDGLRLDRWFKRNYPALALSHLNKIVRKGEVRVDGKRVETATRLVAGATIRVPPLDLQASPAKAATSRSPTDAKALREMTLFEDRDVLVLDKPYGLAVQGGSGTTRHIDGMLAALADADGNRPVLVHRLDRDTSGVLLIAKSRKIAADLGEIFRSRRARKFYWAIVEGVPKPPQGRISLFLAKGAGMGDNRRDGKPHGGRDLERNSARERGRDLERNSARERGRDLERNSARERGRDLERMRVAAHGEEDAQHSITYYAIADKAAPRCAWLSMKPLTGRTHQLRAHAEAIGTPIFGDPKYGHRSEDGVRRSDPHRAMPDSLERKLHLLARRLVLPHPRGGLIDVTAPLPPHMRKTFETFGFETSGRDPIEDAPEE